MRTAILRLAKTSYHGTWNKFLNKSQHKPFSTVSHSRKLLSNYSSVAGVVGFGVGLYLATSVQGETTKNILVAEEHDSIKNEKWTLYQYATCPFCCKVRSFLDYYGVDYEIIEVNPLFRKEIKFSDYRKVPILKSEDYQLNDSSLIISVLKTQLLSDGEISTILTYYPKIESSDDKKKKLEYLNRYNVMYGIGFSKEGHDHVREEMKWRKWVDDTYVHTLSPNIYRTMTEALQAMEYITHVGNFSSFERSMVYYSGAIAMYIIGKRLKKKYHLKDDVRESLYSETNRWVKAVGKDRLFLGGNQPNLADLNMYGVISAIEGLNAFEDLMENTKVSPWYKRMKKKVQSKEGIEQLKIQKMLLPK